MKGRYLLFAVCLGCLAFGGTRADDADTARAATARRVAGGTTTSQTSATSSRAKNTTNDTAAARPSAGASRGNVTTSKSTTNAPRTVNARTTAITDAVRQGTDTANSRTNVITRGNQATSVQSRPTASTARTATSTVSRAAVPARGATAARTATPTTSGRTSTAAARARGATSAKTTARAATNSELRDEIMGRDYTTCRKVYYECMDEFCANKDTQLKRCACSARLHEFDRVKKRLSNVEDKLLDFNQRLLTVNMDKEDAAALFTATEGELAFNQQDTSASKKILDEISKKLNSNTNSSFNQGLSAISLSLNTDAAFDSVDSLMGASTTTKEGTELYSAALPVCREMATEVCDENALAIVESGYQMQIEQDCNTIAKTYETQTDQAREKIREGSALLDISRLDIYQKRNSDDILTCKKKMLAQLSDTSVCGSNLDKCLDISGQYIDPSTGQAFLTTNLANLASLITRPSENQTWTNAPGNDRFVSYLNSKKKYLEPAMENCQDIADYVWDEFIEDALSQIKIAQDSKLEEVRQSCTTLTAQCLSNTAQSIADFDARALSTFGVMADKTANDMCANVKTACSALLETVGGDTDWVGGMSQIATEKTYDTIIQTCREVGRACIIQACKSISGNFGMCESIQNSVNRKSIINRLACWSDVKQCVAEAGEDAINRIFDQIETGDNGSFYKELYGSAFITQDQQGYNNCYQTEHEEAGYPTCIFDICTTECGANSSSYDCRICRLAEKIWGNCEAEPTANIEQDGSHNKILIPKNTSTSTLLSWFAQNTNTQGEKDSCRNTSCPAGYQSIPDSSNNIICTSASEFDYIGYLCPKNDFDRFSPYTGMGKGICCRTSASDGNSKSTKDAIKGDNTSTENCCIGSWKTATKNSTITYGSTIQNLKTCNFNSNTYTYNVVGELNYNLNLVCISNESNASAAITGVTDTPTDPSYPNNNTIKCNGRYVYVDAAGHHIDPHNTTSFMSYANSNKQICTYDPTENKWKCGENTIDINAADAPSSWMINLSGQPIGWSPKPATPTE